MRKQLMNPDHTQVIHIDHGHRAWHEQNTQEVA